MYDGTSKTIIFWLEGSDGPSLKVKWHYSGLTTMLSLNKFWFNCGRTSALSKGMQIKTQSCSAGSSASWGYWTCLCIFLIKQVCPSRHLPSVCLDPFFKHTLNLLTTSPVWRQMWQDRWIFHTPEFRWLSFYSKSINLLHLFPLDTHYVF